MKSLPTIPSQSNSGLKHDSEEKWRPGIWKREEESHCRATMLYICFIKQSEVQQGYLCSANPLPAECRMCLSTDWLRGNKKTTFLYTILLWECSQSGNPVSQFIQISVVVTIEDTQYTKGPGFPHLFSLIRSARKLSYPEMLWMNITGV